MLIYGADRLRKSKTVNNITMQYVWDRGNLAAEISGSTIGSIYNYGPDGIMSKEARNGDKTLYLKNAHGDVVGISGMSGNVFENYRYDAFGNVLSDSEPDRFGYCGEFLDNESGLVYLRNRYYDSNNGRFLSEDSYWNTQNMIYDEKKQSSSTNENILYKSAEDVVKYYNEDDMSLGNISIQNIMQGANLYVYCINNPIAYMDPEGRSVSAYGIYASVGIGVVGYEGMYLWATDDKGNFALLAVNGYSTSFGASIGGIGICFPDMPDITQMYGWGFGISGSIGKGSAGVTFGGDNGQYEGYVFQGAILGADFNCDVSIWAGGDGSYVQPIFSGNIYEISDWVKSAINSILPDDLKI